MSSRPKPKAGTIEFISLGCDKNLVDTERALAILKSKGLKPVPSGQGAEILLINSCGFIGPAKQETIEQILFAVERKKKGEIKVSSLHNMCPLPKEIDPLNASPDHYSLASFDDIERKTAVKVAKNTIDHAVKFDAKAVVLHAGRGQQPILRS